MAHDLCEDLELVADDGGFDDYYWDDDFHFHDDDGFSASPTTPASVGAPRQQQQQQQMGDISASDYKEGEDMQGIPWERLNYTRELPEPHEVAQRPTTTAEEPPVAYFEARRVPGAELLRDALVCPAPERKRGSQRGRPVGPDPEREGGWTVVEGSDQRYGCEGQPHGGRWLPGRTHMQGISRRCFPFSSVSFTRSISHSPACARMHSLVRQYVDRPGVAFCTSLTGGSSSITNAVDIHQAPSGATRVMAANNDCVVRTFDAERYSLLTQLTFPWSVNSTSVSPDGKLLAVLGDSTECVVADPQSGKALATLRGHLDYSFASAWHPDSRVLATGNQDATCRLWDARSLSEPFAVLGARIGAVRGLRFSPDGRFLAAAEAADFVHVYDAAAGYAGAAQEVDVFGEVAGAAFSPDGEALFVSVADRTYGGLLEFRRRRADRYLDACFF
ncbi:putative WD repeat-containing protein C2A9.03 [Zea mays]|uniref:Putative WD repeat-containing protein C2A9.03 n=1 Tax=Zea mays TaxID=4577 RepID=A0A317Y760_MAIZE|nr:putative WD repeat-containing protein C2A9.03 [Zea mays]